MLALAVMAASGCGGAGQPSAPPIPTVVGKPVVTSMPYGLPGTTGYDTIVATTVTNKTGKDILNAPLKVTVTGGGKTLAVSSEDTVSLVAGETRVVLSTPEVTGTKPSAASVKAYEGDTLPGQKPLPNPKFWKTTNVHIQCGTGIVGCEITADLTWTGSGTPTISGADAVVTKGKGGPIVAGGQLSSDHSGPVSANQPIPFKGFIVEDALTSGKVAGLTTTLYVKSSAISQQ